MYLRIWAKQRREKELILEGFNTRAWIPHCIRDTAELWTALLDCLLCGLDKIRHLSLWVILQRLSDPNSGMWLES